MESQDRNETRVDQGARESDRKLLGRRLIEHGLIDESQLKIALRAQKRDGGYLGDILVSLGFVSRAALAEVLGEQTKAPLVNLKLSAPEPAALALIPHERARRHRLIPLKKSGGRLVIAMADTFDVVAVDMAERLAGMPVSVVTASQEDILEAIELHYARSNEIVASIDKILARASSDPAAPVEVDANAPIIDLFEHIITLALKRRATDIHIEPDENISRVRFRVDGVLRRGLMIPKELTDALSARAKLLADLDVTEKRIPQDGRIRFNAPRATVDLRLSTLPTAYGENIVIRILDKSSVTLELEKLGMIGSDHDRFSRAMKSNNGIILACGPTGSGKSSTLYAAFELIDTSALSVFTLEDPIEYKLPMASQTEIRADVGMSFSVGLRALLRQDPDVIMVGEIRDVETAELAIRAAMTGHLVLSTLHTNDAPSAITRLLDMKIEPFLLTSSLSCIVAQRLIRRICSNCRIEAPDARMTIKSLISTERGGDLSEAKLFQGAGCADCAGSGFKGRIGIFETLTITDAIREAIIERRPAKEIRRVAIESGLTSMLEDGIGKALEGITTIQEAMRAL